METLKWYADHSPDVRVMYLITDDDVQGVAEAKIGRCLTDGELETAKRCIEIDLDAGIDVFVNAAIKEATS